MKNINNYIKDYYNQINENDTDSWYLTLEQTKCIYGALCFVDASVKREELCKLCGVDVNTFDELMEDFGDEIKNSGQLSNKISKIAD